LFFQSAVCAIALHGVAGAGLEMTIALRLIFQAFSTFRGTYFQTGGRATEGMITTFALGQQPLALWAEEAGQNQAA
jgi:hypothetical protein